jgi:hypothetical protein
VREFDDQGRVVKETVTECEYAQPVMIDSGDWWRRGQQGWWQNPVISSGGTIYRAADSPYTTTIN